MVEQVAERRAHFNATVAVELEPQRLQLEAIRDVLPDDGVIVEDVTQIGFAAHLMFEFRHPRSFLTTSTAGSLGAGVAPRHRGPRPRYLAAMCWASLVMADSCFPQPSWQPRCSTTSRSPSSSMTTLPSGNVKRIQQLRFGHDRTIASDLRNPDFVMFGESFGMHTQRADDPQALRSALNDAFAHDGPSLIVAKMGEMPNPWPYLRMTPVRGA